MAQPVEIVGGRRARSPALVSPIGQLITAPISYDETQFLELAVANSAYNFFKPRAGEQFVVTAIVLGADKDVGVDGAIVEIYEATSFNTLTADKALLTVSIPQKSALPIVGLNLLVSEGRFINGKTNDDDVNTTIMGYYVPRFPT